MSESMNSVFII